MPDLDNCPFCGHKPQFAISIEGWPHGIWCQTCHMKAEWSNVKLDGKGMTAGMAMEALAERWNRRVKKA